MYATLQACSRVIVLTCTIVDSLSARKVNRARERGRPGVKSEGQRWPESDGLPNPLYHHLNTDGAGE